MLIPKDEHPIGVFAWASQEKQSTVGAHDNYLLGDVPMGCHKNLFNIF